MIKMKAIMLCNFTSFFCNDIDIFYTNNQNASNEIRIEKKKIICIYNKDYNK